MPSRREQKYYNNISRLVTFVLLFIFWMLLSGHYDLFHLSLGFLCSILVAFVSHDLLITNIHAQHRALKTIRFIAYLPWLIYQIILSNIHVAYLVLNPKSIHPTVVRFKTKLHSDLARVTLANSITLTPGTITMDIEGDEFIVHALSKKVADDLLTGEMEDRVARIYHEGEHRPGASPKVGE